MRNGERSVWFEAPTERDFYILMNFDRSVAKIEEQPLYIHYKDDEGVGRRYCPDALVTFEPDSGRKPHLYEIKTSAELAARWQELRPRFKAAVRHCREVGWIFKIVTDAKIRTPRLDNIQLFSRFRAHPIDEPLRQRLLARVRTAQSIALGPLVDEFCNGKLRRADILPTVWRLIHDGELSAAIDDPITAQTLVELGT